MHPHSRMPRLMVIAVVSGTIIQTASAAAQSLIDGKALFGEHCAACHGADAKGDGPDASNSKTPPVDLTEIAKRRDGVWPILEVMSIIDGYTKVVSPREDMPIIPDITTGPMVDIDTGNGITNTVPARLLALAEYLESVQSPKPTRFVP